MNNLRETSPQHASRHPSDPIKDFAAKLQQFLQEQERRARRNRLVLAIGGSAAGLLGIWFSEQIAVTAMRIQPPGGVTEEKLDYFVPCASCILLLLSAVPWLRACLEHHVHSRNRREQAQIRLVLDLDHNLLTLAATKPSKARNKVASPLSPFGRIKYGQAVYCFRKAVRFLQNFCDLVEKLAIRTGSRVLLVIGVR